MGWRRRAPAPREDRRAARERPRVGRHDLQREGAACRRLAARGRRAEGTSDRSSRQRSPATSAAQSRRSTVTNVDTYYVAVQANDGWVIRLSVPLSGGPNDRHEHALRTLLRCGPRARTRRSPSASSRRASLPSPSGK
jgi:hypothetical protein